jgi:hypothetical protein
LRRQVKPASLTAARRRDILTIFGLDEKCEEVSETQIVKMVANSKRNTYRRPSWFPWIVA